jgi:hypothetical protein
VILYDEVKIKDNKETNKRKKNQSKAEKKTDFNYIISSESLHKEDNRFFFHIRQMTSA